MKNTLLIVSTLGCLLGVLIIFQSRSIIAQEVDDEREFDYLKGSKKGPGIWGKIHKEWAVCRRGKMQSPIDLSNTRVQFIQRSNKLQRYYKPAAANITNRGHDICLQWENDAGWIQINGTSYALKQAHWHSPGEHRINGRRYSMELHMVHESTDPNSKYKMVVIAVLYKIGQPNPFLSKLTPDITSLIRRGKEYRRPGIINPREIHMSCRRYYNYIGSLTVPPCTEGVIWTISKKVRTVSIHQVQLLRRAVNDYAEKNSRPLQRENGREIQLIGPP